MAADVREAIMSRLLALLGTIPGVDSTVRNVNLDDDTKRTRIVILEGDELVDEAALARSEKQPPNAPLVIRMQPVIILAVSDKSADVGAALSALRGKVIQAITVDASLIGLTLNGHGGRYLGIVADPADLTFAHVMHLQNTLRYQFTYLLRPDQFA